MAAAAIITAALPGCSTSNDIEPADTDVLELTATQVIERHNARAGLLDELHGRGVIELRWTDDRGRHFEQGDAELWIDQPSRTALRVDKLGEVFIWLGSNEAQWWLFDLTARPRTLYVDDLDSTLAAQRIDVASMHPLTLLDLIGITTVQAIESEMLRVDPDQPAVLVEATGRGGRVELRFDRSGSILLGVTALGPDGEPLAVSRLRDPASVRQPGTNPLNWPKLATTIDIEVVGRDGSLRLALGSNLDGALDGQPIDRIFDLPTLQRALKPEVIEQDGAVESAADGD